MGCATYFEMPDAPNRPSTCRTEAMFGVLAHHRHRHQIRRAYSGVFAQYDKAPHAMDERSVFYLLPSQSAHRIYAYRRIPRAIMTLPIMSWPCTQITACRRSSQWRHEIHPDADVHPDGGTRCIKVSSGDPAPPLRTYLAHHLTLPSFINLDFQWRNILLLASQIVAAAKPVNRRTARARW